MNRKYFKINWYFIIPALLIIAAAGISPFFEALTTSLFHDVYGNRTFAGFDNFKYLGSDSGFGFSLNITALWALLSSAGSIFFGFIVASALSGRRKKLSNVLYGALLIPWGIPVYIAVPLWRALIHGNGGISILTTLFGVKANLLLDPAAGFISCMVVNLWMTVPLTAFVLRGALGKIPVSTIEAAVVDGANPGVMTAYIYLPQIRSSLLVMGLLNFIKAFKEFTLIFLMTSGGPPLMSGITERYIIGSTTTLDLFLYDVFSNTDDLGITSAYSVMMAGIVIFLMAIWYVTRNRKQTEIKKFRAMSIITAVLQLLFGGTAGLLPAAGYLTGIWSRKLFKITAVVQLAWVLFRMVTVNFLEGFTPGILPALFTLYYFRSRLKASEKKDFTDRKFHPRLINNLNSGLSIFSAGFLIISSAAVLYFLLWMSFSGVSACFIDGFLPPHPGTDSYINVIKNENIFLYFKNTLIVAGLTGLLIPAVSFPAAVFLNSRGKAFTIGFLTFIQILGITGGMHSLIPLYSAFSRAGLVNSYLPLIIISIYHSIPFSLFTITAWLERMPKAFRDIALLEGQRPLIYLLRIILPLSKPVLITSFMTAFIGAWNSFMAPLLFLNNEKLYTISVKLYSFVGSIASGSPEWNIFAAASVINCLIIALVFSRFKKPVGETGLSEFTE
ncbi:MAG: ABC transporter permease subunit [Spirochaetales bacterium]|nr:ABC transporter permease subunit [Spirochaetales bacterium]